MKVRDIMTCPPQTCHSSTSLSAASRHMHDSNCGTLVAMDPQGRLAGILTDRDLAVAICDMAGDPSRIPVDTVMTRRVHTCRPDDDLHTAIAKMARWRVRRLPVVDRDGDVTGMISVDDIVLWGIHHGGLGPHSATRALRVIVASSEVVIEPPSL
jgi:CBS domain-containing protein